MQNLQEGRRGSQLRGLECPVWAPIPRPCSAPLAFRAGRKNTDEEKARAAWEGKQMAEGKSVQPDTGGRPLVRGQEKGYPYTSIFPKTPASPGQSLLTCMIGYGSSTPAGMPVLGIILPGQPQGDVAFLSRVHDLHLEVVATGAQWVPGLGQPHINDALALAQVLQQLWGKCREIGSRLTPAPETWSQGNLGTSLLRLTKNPD